MLEINLEELEFFAFHGVSDEERTTGNRYSVDVKIVTEILPEEVKDSISNTIDYGEIYSIVKKEMGNPLKLLETMAANIASHLLQLNSKVTFAKVSVTKHNPPIGGLCKKARVVVEKSR
jgi:dihydroneopterin aldolase